MHLKIKPPVKLPPRIEKEIQKVDNLYKKIERSKQHPQQRSSSRPLLVKSALNTVKMLDEIARCESIKNYLENFGYIPLLWKNHGIHLSYCGQGSTGCQIWHYPDIYEHITEETFYSWSDNDINHLAHLTKRQVWKIILPWLQSQKERLVAEI